MFSRSAFSCTMVPPVLSRSHTDAHQPTPRIPMSRVALAVLFVLPIAAFAAPIPALSEKEQIAKLWGKVHAFAEDDEFKLNGKTLTIHSAGQPRGGLINGEKCQ